MLYQLSYAGLSCGEASVYHFCPDGSRKRQMLRTTVEQSSNISIPNRWSNARCSSLTPKNPDGLCTKALPQMVARRWKADFSGSHYWRSGACVGDAGPPPVSDSLPADRGLPHRVAQGSDFRDCDLNDVPVLKRKIVRRDNSGSSQQEHSVRKIEIAKEV